MHIRKLNRDEKPPMELLLLADPSKELVEEYVKRGECYLAESEQQIIGCMYYSQQNMERWS